MLALSSITNVAGKDGRQAKLNLLAFRRSNYPVNLLQNSLFKLVAKADMVPWGAAAHRRANRLKKRLTN